MSSVMLLGSEEKGGSVGWVFGASLGVLFDGFGELLVALEELEVSSEALLSGLEELPVGFGEPRVRVDIARSYIRIPGVCKVVGIKT